MDEWLITPLIGMGPCQFGDHSENFQNYKELYGGDVSFRESALKGRLAPPTPEALAELEAVMPDVDWMAQYHERMEATAHLRSISDEFEGWQFSDGPRLATFEDRLIEIACDPGDTRPWLEDVDLFGPPPQDVLSDMTARYGAPMYDGGDGLYWVQPRLLLTGFVHGFNGEAAQFGPRSNGPEDKPSIRIDSPDYPEFDTVLSRFQTPFRL